MIDAPIRIETKRLVLRERREGDFPAFHALVSDPEVIRYCAIWPHPADEELTRSRFTPVAPERGLRVAITKDGRYIGQTAIIDGALGLMLARETWGRGLALEATHALIGHVFATRPDLAKIQAGHFTENTASARLLAKLGFVEIGRVMQASAFHGADLPGVELVLTRADWEAAQTGLTYRPLQAEDADALHAIASDWNVVRQLGGWPWPPNRAFTEGRSKPHEGPGFIWGVFRGGTLVGTVGVKDGDLGYMYRLDQAGRGLATTAGTAALTEAFAQGLQEVTGSAWVDNPASARVLLKLGFREEAMEQDYSKARRSVMATRRFRLSRQDWLASRQVT
ncbi:GNAT family N-acetyltransferase [Pseudoroseicyclus sp. H15]